MDPGAYVDDVAAFPDKRADRAQKSNEKLYDAYNELHSMAQAFDKPFDAPAVLVVGHQTDGKSGDSIAGYCV